MLAVSRVQSTNKGKAPQRVIASVVAMNVFGTVITASPGLTPATTRANQTASVPLATPDNFLYTQKVRKLPLEGADIGTADKAGTVDDIGDGGFDLAAHFFVLSTQIDKRNIGAFDMVFSSLEFHDQFTTAIDQRPLGGLQDLHHPQTIFSAARGVAPVRMQSRKCSHSDRKGSFHCRG